MQKAINRTTYTDGELVSACQDQQAWAQRELYQRYKNRMMAFCFRYFYRKDLAEEFFQEGFVRFFQKIDLFDTAYPLYPWMKKMFLRAGINYLQKYYGDKYPVDLPEELPEPEIGNTEKELISRLSYEELLQQLELLKKEEALMINLALIDGLSHREISELLGISVGNSRVKLLRAKQQFINLINHHKQKTDER